MLEWSEYPKVALEMYKIRKKEPFKKIMKIMVSEFIRTLYATFKFGFQIEIHQKCTAIWQTLSKAEHEIPTVFRNAEHLILQWTDTITTTVQPVINRNLHDWAIAQFVE